MPQLFFSTFFNLYCVRNPDTTDSTDSTRAVQGARYNQLATTPYTPTAACPRYTSITAVASYLIVGCFCYRTLLSVGLRVCCCMIHACCHSYYNTDIFCATPLGTWQRGTLYMVYIGYAAVPHSIPRQPNQPINIVFPSTASKSAESTSNLHKRQHPSTGQTDDNGNAVLQTAAMGETGKKRLFF